MREGMLIALVLLSPVLAARSVVYTVDPARSEFVVRLFKAGVGSALAHDHVVRATHYSGRIQGDPDEPSSVSIDVEVQSASLRADEPATRARYGLSALPSDSDREEIQRTMESTTQLDVAGHPTMRFHSTRVERNAGDRFTVTGELTIRDVGQPVSFPAIVEQRDGALHARGSFRFRQSSFGFRPYSAFLGAVKNQDEVVLEFDVVAPP
jgi:polyisoprenoid-binding protein YceI